MPLPSSNLRKLCLEPTRQSGAPWEETLDEVQMFTRLISPQEPYSFGLWVLLAVSRSPTQAWRTRKKELLNAKRGSKAILRAAIHRNTHNTISLSLSLLSLFPPHSHTQKQPNGEKQRVYASSEMKRQEFFFLGKNWNELCVELLWWGTIHTHLWLGGDGGGKGRRGWGKWKTCLFICSPLLKLGCLALSSLPAASAGDGRERERETDRFCFGLACCVVYTWRWAHNKVAFFRPEKEASFLFICWISLDASSALEEVCGWSNPLPAFK